MRRQNCLVLYRVSDVAPRELDGEKAQGKLIFEDNRKFEKLSLGM